ncbi:MAG: HesA/MoeB/ThiF family protein [Pyrinomonadaceae bacterium]
MHKEFSVTFDQSIRQTLSNHLIREDREEDLCFALWNPSSGSKRFTALLLEVVLPEPGDRQRHGNVSFNPQYFERVCRLALEKDAGIAFMHSHPGSGWQDMSKDDIAAEQRLAGPVLGLTDQPLVGLTVGNDDVWSARLWHSTGDRNYKRSWCRSVRSIGERLDVTFADFMVPRPRYGEMFKRTVAVWGEQNHAKLARLRIGIVGLGSVGSFIAETLARSGFENIVLIDFDEIQEHNLDRLVIGTRDDIGKLKVEVAKERMSKVSTAHSMNIEAIPYSVAEEKGYFAALDCDVLFSCVDRPRARQILNHFAYAHLIPVIDGGIAVRFKNGQFSGVDWQLQTVGPGRPCLECLGCFSVGDVSIEIAGKLDDPSYLKGLGADHHLKRNENIFAFSENLASLEFFQLISLATSLGGFSDFGIQRFRYIPGIIDSIEANSCRLECHVQQLLATGDRHFTLMGQDLTANAARVRQQGQR